MITEMLKMMTRINVIKCEICGHDFESAYTVKDIIDYFNTEYPEIEGDRIIMCDDCFNEMPDESEVIH